MNASKLPINATSRAQAERIGRDLFATQAPEGVNLTSFEFDHEESERPFARVAASETGGTGTMRCYVFAVEWVTL